MKQCNVVKYYYLKYQYDSLEVIPVFDGAKCSNLLSTVTTFVKRAALLVVALLPTLLLWMVTVLVGNCVTKKETYNRNRHHARTT